ncbi:MAG TPA: L,D-transpeptidase family protein [Sphingomicrobium sp.]|nr:L,D-transpeptidase family protein [Sphingomicrobium sp.]
MKYWLLAALALALSHAPGATALAQQVELGGRPLLEAAGQLKAGQFIWESASAPDGPTLLIVNLATQRAMLFRNGVPMAASTVSTGRPGYETPTGVFTILEKHKEHYSRKYDNAPMPNMQRLTWKGIALHGGNLPGYPASHGCIRLPYKFAELLFGATRLGMTVVITSVPAVPENSSAPHLAAPHPADDQPIARAPFEWHPQRESKGMVSVIISAADQHAIVLRGGKVIGSAPVRVGGDVKEGWAYVLKSWDKSGQHWLKLQFSGPGKGMEVPAGEGDRFEAPWDFERAVQTLLRPGSIVIVTPESLRDGSSGSELTVIDTEPEPKR